MNDFRVLAVFGTRPEAIKLAPVILRLRETRGVVCRTCATAQHRSMLDQVLELFGIVADHDLDVMALTDHDHWGLELTTSRLSQKIEAGAVFQEIVDKENVVIVALQSLSTLFERRYPIQLDRWVLDLLDKATGHHEVTLIVVDQESADGSFRQQSPSLTNRMTLVLMANDTLES